MKGLHLTHRSFPSTLQARNARVTINAVHPGIVKTGIIRAHKGFITGMDSRFFPPSSSMLHVNQCCSGAKWNLISSKFFHSHADSVFFIASKLLKSTSQGASTTCYVALSPELEGVTGKYFADCNESECSNLANDESEAYKLWKQTRILIHRRLCQPTT